MKWFRSEGERQRDRALEIRAAYHAGALVIVAPPFLRLEIVNIAGRRWRWSEDDLLELATTLDETRFQWIEPDLTRVAHWTARGLSAYDACYVAIAEARGVQLITDDRRLVAVAGEIAIALADVQA